MLVLDSGAVSFLAERSSRSRLLLARLRDEGLWPARVPTAVLVECLTGHAGRDPATNRMLNSCDIDPGPSERLARRAAALRTATRLGSAVDAIVVASAEPGGVILTTDVGDVSALAGQARGVRVVEV